MSVVTIQVGQCGNQVGQSFLNSASDGALKKINADNVSSLNQKYTDLTAERFFAQNKNESWTARAVLIDTEHKVIDKLFTSKKSLWQYSRKNAVELFGGCGNLWSRGYCECGPVLSEKTIDIVQTELEKCDSVGGLLLIFSAAGGTGSGVGSHLTQVFRDSFPRTFLFNQLVWPYSAGEVVIQSYNAILTLSHVLPYTDAILNFFNDELHQICSSFNTPINIDNLNKVMGDQLAHTLCPSFNSEDYVTRLGDSIEHLASHTGFKMLSVKSVPHNSPQAKDFSTDTWKGLTKLLIRKTNHQFVSFGDLIIKRGRNAKNADISEFITNRKYASIIPAEEACQVWHEEMSVSKDRLNITLVSNSAEIVTTLKKVTDRAWHLMNNGAYLHHLAKHGIGQEQLTDSMTCAAQVCKNYKSLN